MRTRKKITKCVWVLAMTLGLGISGSAVRAAAFPASQDQGQSRDYSKNKNYQQGLRDGRDDYAHKLDHSKKRHFKKDEDQKAYEAGYQQGHQADQADHHER